ncbi:DUF3631 domain-containing protein [Streptomyces lavendulocolor]|uniref:DUF3631 domain-containing protein n=1 Tax=Streptomyces lavendulocolor TaxID=67316 RepID=UPI003C309861
MEATSDGALLLDEQQAAIGRYVVLPSQEALSAVTLWVAASHIQPAPQHAPRLAVVGPTKGCGKSRVLDVLHESVHQPMMTVNTSPAVVFRVIGKNPPTLPVDEAHTIFGPKAGEKEDLRGLLNAGHQRNRPAWRISGPEHKPTAFPTFAMAALAGIGDLPDTIMDRAVVLRMQKRKPGERITPFRSRYSVPKLHAARDRLAAWLTPLRGTAARLVPKMPVEDRAADTWEPLVIVADLAGGHWLAKARAACLTMTRHEAVQDEQTILKTRLLRDIRRTKTIRFTPTAVRLISAAARQRGQKFAGFVGDAALAVALGKAGMVGSPEDDPIRPLVEAIEAHIVALNRVGHNLNRPRRNRRPQPPPPPDRSRRPPSTRHSRTPRRSPQLAPHHTAQQASAGHTQATRRCQDLATLHGAVSSYGRDGRQARGTQPTPLAATVTQPYGVPRLRLHYELRPAIERRRGEAS